MKQHYLSLALALSLVGASGVAHGQCVSGTGTTMIAPAGQTPEPQQFTAGAITAGVANITIIAPTTGTVGLVNGMVISGPPGLFAPGTVLTGKRDDNFCGPTTSAYCWCRIDCLVQ
ncbi:MAG: hypothetical protein IPJ85_00095 [Flavobacteriales bacterium]|nr:hypothetical protein [Flavobacteriales bacterium]